jgi:urease accessory protein
MFKTEFPESDFASEKFTFFRSELNVSNKTSLLVRQQGGVENQRSTSYRYLGAIASLLLLSLLSSFNGVTTIHYIGDFWEGLLWGLADPVIALNSLAGAISVGLLSPKFTRGGLIPAFALAAMCGVAVNLLEVNLPTTEVAIAISTMVFGIMLMLPTRANWLVMMPLLGVAGFFHGYSNGEAIVGAQIGPQIAYLLGFGLTQYVVPSSTKEVVKTTNMGTVYQSISNNIHLIGFALCALGFSCLGKSFF